MKNIIFISSFILISFLVRSQEISTELISTAGNYFTNSEYQLEWTVGEVITEQFSSDEFVLTQGFQQGDVEVTAINEISSENFDIKIFPNPATDFLSVVSNEKNIDFKISISDITGKKIINLSEKNISNTFQINISDLTSGIYFLKIVSSLNKNLKIYKIIKKY